MLVDAVKILIQKFVAVTHRGPRGNAHFMGALSTYSRHVVRLTIGCAVDQGWAITTCTGVLRHLCKFVKLGHGVFRPWVLGLDFQGEARIIFGLHNF